MFGYIRPLKDELKVREFEQFKAQYCALCHTLKARYGAFARNILNYDFTFLAMLLWDEGGESSYKCVRCLASPLVKKKICSPTRTLDICAGYSVILAYWKLKDSVADEGFWRSLRDRGLMLLLYRAYRKASREFPAFTETVRSNLKALQALEKGGDDAPEGAGSYDALADKFARITEALAEETAGDSRYRPLRQLLYHAGRTIFLLDACDDLEEDTRRGRFNPLARRYAVTGGKLNAEDQAALRSTILHSCGLMGAAYALLPKNCWSPILDNIIYLGMPDVSLRVLSGTWKRNKVPENKRNGQYYE